MARNKLDEVRAALERKNTIQKGVRDAEGAVADAEDNVSQWKATRKRAQLDTVSAVKGRETTQAKLKIAQLSLTPHTRGTAKCTAVVQPHDGKLT